MEGIKEHAVAYENAYNDVQRSIEMEESLRRISEALPEATAIQVRAEKDRLVEARRISRSEKRAYVSVNYSDSTVCYSTGRKTHTNLHPGPEWHIFHILTGNDIDDVISRFHTVESGKRVLSI